MIPGLAAHLLFMCVRHSDYLNDGNKLKSLMHGVITAIKEIIAVRDCFSFYFRVKYELLLTHAAFCFNFKQTNAKLA